jgi:hypothetical protein
MIDVQSSLEHHLLQISVDERIPQVPPDAEQNDFGLEVTPFEWCDGIHESSSYQCSEYRRAYYIIAIFATQPKNRFTTALVSQRGYFTSDVRLCYTVSIALAVRKRYSRSFNRSNGTAHNAAVLRVAENRRTPDEFHQPPRKPVDAPAPG